MSLALHDVCVFFSCYREHRGLHILTHSFPTRRSSHLEPLENIMRKVARWYDVDVIFEDEAIKQYAFVGVIDRFSNVSEVLNMLQLTGKVQFRIENRTIVVTEK